MDAYISDADGWAMHIQGFAGSDDDQLHGVLDYVKPRTRAFYRCQLRLLAAWAAERRISVESFTAANMRAYIAYRRKTGRRSDPTQPISDTTLHHDGVAASAFFAHLARNGYLPADPLAGYKLIPIKKKKMIAPSEELLKAFFDATERYYSVKHNPASMRFVTPVKRTISMRRILAVVALCIDTAARIDEILHVSLQDYKPVLDQRGRFIEGKLLLRFTKNGNEREVPFKALSHWYVEEYLKVRPRQAGRHPEATLFVGPTLEMADYNILRKTMQRIQKFAGLPAFSFHGFRRYGLSCLAHVDILDATRIADHSDPKTTMTYLSTTFEHVKGTHDIARPLDRLFTEKQSEEPAKLKKPRYY